MDERSHVKNEFNQKIQEIFNDWIRGDGEGFSGVYSVTDPSGVVFRRACGCRNVVEKLVNTEDTAFAIASGTKMFTGLAVCKLIDEKKLSLDDRLWDLLSVDLGQIDKRVTVLHLLTHTSGVGDYIDEESENCDEQLQALRDKYPAHLWDNLEYYLQMITCLPLKFEPGERYSYSNAGFVLLGLVIEAVSKISFQQYVTKNIIKPCNMKHTGFYRMDSLPYNTAYGYIRDEDTDELRTNIFSMPIIGGSDGGLFTCADDLDILWRAVFNNKILSEQMTEEFLKPQVIIDEDNDASYGLGIYSIKQNDNNRIYYAVGGDAGVDFVTMYFPKTKTVASALCNIDDINTFPLAEDLVSILE